MSMIKIVSQIARLADSLDSIGLHSQSDKLDSILEKLASDVPKVYDLKRGGYAAIVLDEGSRDALLSWWRDELDYPLHDNVIAHHMTIKFQPSERELAELPVGETAEVTVVGWAADSRGQAVKVESSVPSSNAVPHITVAVAPGVKPVYSNELLASGVNPISGPTLSGIVEYVVPGK